MQVDEAAWYLFIKSEVITGISIILKKDNRGKGLYMEHGKWTRKQGRRKQGSGMHKYNRWTQITRQWETEGGTRRDAHGNVNKIQKK